MATVRHTTAANRVADDLLLDAAKDCVLASGVRRTTLSEVARRAGVSRMTLYRRFPDVRGMLAALITREFGGIITEADDVARGSASTARERLVVASVHTIRKLGTDPFMHTILDRDAELLLPYLVERIGTSQRMVEQYLHTQLAAGHADGSIRVADVAVQARSIFLLLQPYVITIRPSISDVAFDDLIAELTRLLDAALRPEADRQ